MVWQVELCWPDEKIAVIIDHEPSRETWLASGGWRVATVDEDTDVARLARTIETWLGATQA